MESGSNELSVGQMLRQNRSGEDDYSYGYDEEDY